MEERSNLMPADDVGAERFFLFVSPPLSQSGDYLLESVYCQNLDSRSAHESLIQGIIRPDVVIIASFDEESVSIIKLLKDLTIPVVYYTPQFIPAAKEVAFKFQVDDYLFGAINEDFVKHVDFLKKMKLRKSKSATRKISLAKPNPAVVPKMWRLKRLSDIGLSFSALLCLSPLLVIIGIAVKLESKGPVFYIAKRSGKGFKIFDFYKFRTMRDGAAAELVNLVSANQYNGRAGDNVFFKIKDDPRTTKLGRFLRNTSLDELPQLLNVLKGDMSLVGNRPLPLYEAVKLTRDQIAWRFLAPAGITGLWQVTKRGKDNMSPQERIELDMMYARKNSFLYDMKILMMTVPAMLQKEKV